MKVFTLVTEVVPTERWNDHDGNGPISFRRMFNKADFETAIDFIDYTVVPAGSTIGLHEHHGNEEIYFIAAGNPLMQVNGEQRRLEPGSFAVVRDGGAHELINDTGSDVEILVVQVCR